MQTNIIVKLQVEGTHNWPTAGDFEPTMKYLEYQHRHMFHIDARREVFHDDRDVEFIVFKRKIKDYLVKKYYNSEIEWLYKKIYMCAKEANDKIFNFKLFYSKDSIQYSKYSENGKYDWHIDIGQKSTNLRKLSCSILLNDPEEFEGGDFEYWTKNVPEKVPLKKGSILFFPSFFLLFLPR